MPLRLSILTGLLPAVAVACSHGPEPSRAPDGQRAATPADAIDFSSRIAPFDLDPPARIGQPGARPWQPLPALPVAKADYRDGFVTVTGMPLDTVPVAGLVRYPQTPPPPHGWPFVLLVHGVHNNCTTPSGDERCVSARAFNGACPEGLQPVASAAGLGWLADTLAAHGAVVVALDANWLNCDGRDVALEARVQLVLAHLKRWRAWQEAGTGPAGLGAAVDLHKVALVGHSVGGEAVLLAARAVRDEAAVAGVDVTSLLLVAPSDFTAASLDPWPVAVVLSECDLDGTQGPGRHVAERGLQRTGAPRLLVHVGGASHNEYNAAWRDEVFWAGKPACTGGRKLNGPAMRAVLGAMAADWIDAGLADREPSPWLRGDEPLPADLVRWIGRPPDLRMDYAAPVREVLPLGVHASGDVDLLPCAGHACDADIDNNRAMLIWQWRREAAVTWILDPPVDVRRFSHLAVRLVRPHQPDAAHELRLTLRLTDRQGRKFTGETGPIPAVPDPSQVDRTPGQEHLYPGVPLTVRVPLAGAALGEVARVQVVLPARKVDARLVVAEVEWQGP